jgi:hypothetical protein
MTAKRQRSADQRKEADARSTEYPFIRQVSLGIGEGHCTHPVFRAERVGKHLGAHSHSVTPPFCPHHMRWVANVFLEVGQSVKFFSSWLPVNTEAMTLFMKRPRQTIRNSIRNDWARGGG